MSTDRKWIVVESQNGMPWVLFVDAICAIDIGQRAVFTQSESVMLSLAGLRELLHYIGGPGMLHHIKKNPTAAG